MTIVLDKYKSSIEIYFLWNPGQSIIITKIMVKNTLVIDKYNFCRNSDENIKKVFAGHIFPM